MNALGIDIGGTSVKAAIVRDGSAVWTGRSARYAMPTRDQLTAAVVSVVAARPADTGKIDAAGLCAPGLLNRAERTITHSVNLPSLVGLRLDDIVAAAVGRALASSLLHDTHAAAYDLYVSRKITGRLLVLVLGTGVGAAVLDEGGPLCVDGESPGHFGQMDVSIEGDPVIGPDGGAGSLEGYIGSPALAARYGPGFFDRLPTLDAHEPPLRALARAVRIGHALYRPHHVCLAGAIGNQLRPLLPRLRETIQRHLTRIARPAWTLATGDHDFHAALGAARLAAAGA